VSRPTLTAREQAVLDAITGSVRDRGYPPSLQEIGDQVGLASVGSVHRVLLNLELKGAIRRAHNLPRAITVIDLTAVPS
jgi:repressor LexA